MRIAKHQVIRAALPVLAFFVACTATQAKELKVRGSRHARSAIYFQERPEPAASDWYTPTRSPGWHDEIGS